MRGTMLIIRPDGTQDKVEIANHLALKTLQDAVGGYLELVPHLTKYNVDGTLHEVVAFCNEQGKLQDLPINLAATLIWQLAAAPNHLRDILVGNVVLLWGDKEFMNSI